MKRKHILIVDDEARVAFFLREGLIGLGNDYEVHTLPSAELALQQIEQQPVDLLVADLRLPGMNGLELIRRVRQLDPAIKTILITAYGSPEIENEAYQLAAQRYMRKPFSIQELMGTVQGILT